MNLAETFLANKVSGRRVRRRWSPTTTRIRGKLKFRC